MSRSQIVWPVVGILSLITIAALATALALYIIRFENPLPSTFACSTVNQDPVPACSSTLIASGIPGASNGNGFFTLPSLRIAPSFTPTPSLSPTPPLTGYYHAHPTAYYTDSPGGVLFSYPFVLQVTASGSSAPPTMHLAGYNFSPHLRETGQFPPQFAYSTTALDTFTNGYTMSIPCSAATDTAFQPDPIAYPATGGMPTLTSVLWSRQDPGTRKTRIITTQGTPYVMINYEEQTTGAIITPVLNLDVSQYASSSIQTIVVSSPPSRTFNAYVFWSSRGHIPARCIVWFCDVTTPQAFHEDPTTGATLSIGSTGPGLAQGMVYMTMFANVGPLLTQVMQLIADSLMPHFIHLTDIIPSNSNSSMQFTVSPIPGGTLNAGSSTLWIVPLTSFHIAGLASVTLPGSTYLDFPLGNGLFQTTPQVGVAVFTSFYTLWPAPIAPINDFSSYALSPGGFNDTSSTCGNDLDMYDLAMAIRILTATPGHAATDEQRNTCGSNWNTKLSNMGVADFTLFTTQLEPQDAGLLSRIAYLLLTAVHLNRIKGSLNINSSLHGYITNANQQLTMLIEGGLITVPMAQSFAGGVYTPLAFLDVYSGTMPVIKTVGPDAVAPSLPQLTSRLGEVLGYLWACDNLVANGFVVGPSLNVGRLCRTLMSITNEATSRLLRGQCTAPSVPTLAPVMPWTSLVSQTKIAFQLDGASPGGISPDAMVLQSFTPFTPASHFFIRPMISSLSIQIEKLLRCSQLIPQASPEHYVFNNFVDPNLVGYFAYLYVTTNQTRMLQTGQVELALQPFIKMVSLQHPSVALLMNLVKLGQIN